MSEELKEGKHYYTTKGIEKCHMCEFNGVVEVVTPKGEVLEQVPDYVNYKNICYCFNEEHKANYNLLEEIEEFKKKEELIISELNKIIYYVCLENIDKYNIFSSCCKLLKELKKKD